MRHLANENRCEDALTPCKSLLLASLELGGNQANAVHTRAAHDINRARHLGKKHRIVALYERDLLRALFENLLDPRPQTIPSNVILIDLEFSVGVHLDHNRQVFERGILLGVRWSGLGNQSLEALWGHRRDDHKDDDEDQQDVNQWHDVHVGQRATLRSAYLHSHDERSRKSKFPPEEQPPAAKSVADRRGRRG